MISRALRVSDVAGEAIWTNGAYTSLDCEGLFRECAGVYLRMVLVALLLPTNDGRYPPLVALLLYLRNTPIYLQ